MKSTSQARKLPSRLLEQSSTHRSYMRMGSKVVFLSPGAEEVVTCVKPHLYCSLFVNRQPSKWTPCTFLFYLIYCPTLLLHASWSPRDQGRKSIRKYLQLQFNLHFGSEKKCLPSKNFTLPYLSVWHCSEELEWKQGLPKTKPNCTLPIWRMTQKKKVQICFWMQTNRTIVEFLILPIQNFESFLFIHMFVFNTTKKGSNDAIVEYEKVTIIYEKIQIGVLDRGVIKVMRTSPS